MLAPSEHASESFPGTRALALVQQEVGSEDFSTEEETFLRQLAEGVQQRFGNFHSRDVGDQRGRVPLWLRLAETIAATRGEFWRACASNGNGMINELAQALVRIPSRLRLARELQLLDAWLGQLAAQGP
jgi:hypothetical protein